MNEKGRERRLSKRKSQMLSNGDIESPLLKEKFLNRRAGVPPQELEMLSIIQIIKSNPQFTLNDLQLSDEKIFTLVLFLMKKPAKNSFEVLLIRQYLYTLPSFVAMLMKSQYEVFNEIITRVANYIAYEILEKDGILFKTGDKGDRFYIILNGKIGILVAKELKVRMNEQEYLKHLLKLKSLSENELFSRTIQANRNIYPIDEENFDDFMSTLGNMSPHKTSNANSALSSPIKKPIQQKLSFIKKSIALRSSQIKEVLAFQQRMSFSETKFGDLQKKYTVEEYLQFMKPDRKDDNSMFTEITIWEYHHILTLKTGDTFGEVALELNSQKRTATMISIEDCTLGYLSKEIYNDCIKEANERSRRTNISLILTSQIFKGINKQTFEKKQLLNLFVNYKLRQGDVIIEENTEAQYLYLIKDGEYLVSMTKSINEINVLIKEFGGVVEEEQDKKLFLNDILYKKFIHQKHQFKISSVKDKDVIGLSDYIYMDKYFCRVQCTSPKGEAFKLNKQFYENLGLGEKNMRDNYNDYTQLKKKILLEKLYNIKKIRISCFRNMNYEKDNFIRTPTNNELNSMKDTTSPNNSNSPRKKNMLIKITNYLTSDKDKNKSKIQKEDNNNRTNTKTLSIKKNTSFNYFKQNVDSYSNFNTTNNMNFIENSSNKINLQYKTNIEFARFSILNDENIENTENDIENKNSNKTILNNLNIRNNLQNYQKFPNLINNENLSNYLSRSNSDLKIINKDDLNNINSSHDSDNFNFQLNSEEKKHKIILPDEFKNRNSYSKHSSATLKILLKNINLKSPSSCRVQGNFINYKRVPIYKSQQKKITLKNNNEANNYTNINIDPYNQNAQNSNKSYSKHLYQIKKNSYTKSNLILNYTTSPNDKQILYNLIDKMVYTKTESSNPNETSSTQLNNVNVIDCLVLDKMIENSQFNHMSRNKNANKQITNNPKQTSFNQNLTIGSKLFETYSLPYCNTVITNSQMPNILNSFNKNIKSKHFLTEKINLRGKTSLQLKNKTKFIFSENSSTKLKSSTHLVDTEKNKDNNCNTFYFNENLTAMASDRNFKPKKYKFISCSKPKLTK